MDGGNEGGATSNRGVKHASSALIGPPSLEIHFCSSTVSSDKFRIFLMENEFPPAENEEMPGVQDAIPVVAIRWFLFRELCNPGRRVTWRRL